MNVARRRPELIVWAMMAAFSVVFSYLAVARQRAFWTGRFDLGNMVQAVWSTAQGRPLETTDVGGVQFVRLGAHVDPILVLFTPLAWTGALPEALLVAQVLIVASGALPAYWLGRRWLADTRLAVAAAAVYLLYPPLQWTVVTEFHPVALAAPLLMFCIWAAEERRFMTLTIFAVLAALTKEEVALALAMLGVWMMVRGITRRRYGAFLAAASLAWVAFAVLWIIPTTTPGRAPSSSTATDRSGRTAAGSSRPCSRGPGRPRRWPGRTTGSATSGPCCSPCCSCRSRRRMRVGPCLNPRAARSRSRNVAM